MFKKARRQGRAILFIDETGLSERPTHARTWAPPLLRYSFNWTHLTAIAALGYRKFYFRFVQGAIQKKQIVDFLRSLPKQISRKLLIIRDGLPGHRSAVVTNYLASTNGKIVMECLPGYAPELNPPEYIWAYAKQHELANLCRNTIREVKAFAINRFKSMQRRVALIHRSGSKQAWLSESVLSCLIWSTTASSPERLIPKPSVLLFLSEGLEYRAGRIDGINRPTRVTKRPTD